MQFQYVYEFLRLNQWHISNNLCLKADIFVNHSLPAFELTTEKTHLKALA